MFRSSPPSLPDDTILYINSLGKTELRLEVRRSHAEVVARLLKCELDIYQLSKYGGGHLSEVIRREHAEYIHVLASIEQLLAEMEPS
jgi:hypothetical protein